MKRVLLVACFLLPSSLVAQIPISADRVRPPFATATNVGVVQDSSRKPSRAGRLAIGISVGAIVGGAIGYGIGKASCSSNLACDAPGPEYAGGVLGIVLGGTVGGIIGYAWDSSPAPEQAFQMARPRPILKLSIALY